MTLHIISDNPLLLMGISEKIREELTYSESFSIKIHYTNFSEKEIDTDDTVLICIYSKLIRMNVLARITKLTQNIAIMVDCLFEQEMTIRYPIRVSRRMSFRDIIGLSKRMRRQPAPAKVCTHTYNIFKELYNGSSIQNVVEKKKLNLTTTYNLKNRVFRKFGLKNINDKGIIHCMEYLEVNRLARESMGLESSYQLNHLS